MSEERLNCLDFSNEEIIEYLVNVPRKFPTDIRYKIDDKYVNISDERNFEYLIFDGEKENLFIGFEKTMCSICFGETEEIYFITNDTKKWYTISDTQYTVVYEGALESKTRCEILKLFSKLIDLFGGATDTHIESKELPRKEEYTYPRCEYKIEMNNSNVGSGVFLFDNIKIVIK